MNAPRRILWLCGVGANGHGQTEYIGVIRRLHAPLPIFNIIYIMRTMTCSEATEPKPSIECHLDNRTAFGAITDRPSASSIPQSYAVDAGGVSSFGRIHLTKTG